MGIVEVIIQVGDVEAAATFYSTVCGFDLVRTVEQDGARVAELDAGGVRVTLVAAPSPGVRLALGCSDVHAQQRGFREASVTVHTPVPVEVDGGTWLSFEDPWGNRLGLWQTEQ